MIAEGCPALWNRGFRRDGRSLDRHDAYSVAEWLQRADLGGRQAGCFGPELSSTDRAKAQIEGWILGVL